jgi:hypothetical protein
MFFENRDVTEINQYRKIILMKKMASTINFIAHNVFGYLNPPPEEKLTLIATGIPLGFIIAFCTMPPLPLPRTSQNY